jgi:methylated-DNA-[protein]-cysteine S-methyltransferase
MKEALKYTIFQTKWGYFGLAGTESGLCRSCLPLAQQQRIKVQLLRVETKADASSVQYSKDFFKPLQEKVAAYFEGICADFCVDTPIILNGLNYFTRAVLTACREIGFGRTTSYSALARKLGSPGAARAVGNALAKNPLPLIIPCHRVVRSDGKLGGFSTAGGNYLKAKLIKHEQMHKLRKGLS